MSPAAVRTVKLIGASMASVAALTACGSASTHDHGVTTDASPQVLSANFDVDDVAFAANMMRRTISRPSSCRRWCHLGRATPSSW